jgi:hypothetical protein
MDKKPNGSVVYHTVQVFDEHIPPAEGEGTGTAGAVRPTPGKVVPCTEIIEFDEQALSATAEPGGPEG